MTRICLTLPAELANLWIYVGPDETWQCYADGADAAVPGWLATQLVAKGYAEHADTPEPTGAVAPVTIRLDAGVGVWSPWAEAALTNGQTVSVPASERDTLERYPRANHPPFAA